MIGEVDEATRLARVIVSVPNPLGSEGEPPLVLGSVVRVELEARPIEDVVRLERSYLRQGDTVWVMDGGELRVREAEVLFADDRFAYLRSGVESGEKVVTTNLATVVDGLSIREADDAAETREQDGADGGGRS